MFDGQHFDRGIKKWQGFILSEHNEQLEQQQMQESWKPGMSPEEIEQILSEALLHQDLIKVQKKREHDDPDQAPEPMIRGRIAGIDAGFLVLRTDSELVQVSVDAIHHVENARGDDKWYT
ncbi:hypothetical protein [Listeria aquatica]|uniref:Uncharacterized protein n=1 Tax=Listeria aquatica FSL S10-1188 TaxID=1265818 RepID=W7AMZ2_9LIST|nr:hypothetical protein [Listeria aquatica]EUJ16614.1 hypothetical protein MAQA_15806 [Listeria aquatica FSL S10-1188]